MQFAVLRLGISWRRNEALFAINIYCMHISHVYVITSLCIVWIGDILTCYRYLPTWNLQVLTFVKTTKEIGIELQNSLTINTFVNVSIFMMTSSNGNIFRITGHLCGEFTGHRWILHTKASDTELWSFLWSASEYRSSKQSWGWWFETLSCPLRRHRNLDTSHTLYNGLSLPDLNLNYVNKMCFWC